MNTTARRRRTRYAELEEAVRVESSAKEHLLDIVNALLLRSGGSISIPAAEVTSAVRHEVVVDVLPADPDEAGSQARYVISLRDYTPPVVERAPSLLERIGLWVPGR